jgi:hypothetical protein
MPSNEKRSQSDAAKLTLTTGSIGSVWTSQDSVDTSASSSGSFEFLRTYAA